MEPNRVTKPSFLKRRTPQEHAEHPKNTTRPCHKTQNWRLNTSNIPRILIKYPQNDFDHLFRNNFGAGRAILYFAVGVASFARQKYKIFSTKFRRHFFKIFFPKFYQKLCFYAEHTGHRVTCSFAGTCDVMNVRSSSVNTQSGGHVLFFQG